ncbi:MAG: response regulator [Archangium sp.]
MNETAPSILVVDDEENVFKSLSRCLRREGYQLTHAATPEEALRLLAQHDFHIVLSDHLMPGMTGLQFLTLVRSRFPNAVRIMLTGHADLQTAIDAINRGHIYRFLSKPWDDLELKAALYFALEYRKESLENRRLLSMIRTESLTATRLEAKHPGITHVKRTETGAILLDAEPA